MPTEVPLRDQPRRDAMSEIPSESWEGCSIPDLQATWKVPEIHLFTVLGSTNDVVRRLAASGSPSATVVIAEEQRAGRGRVSRAWSSPPGVGLWCSILLRDLPASAISPLPLKVAVAAAAALDSWVEGGMMVKWPNDLVYGGRKIGGILCEGSWEHGRLEYVAVGIGLNLLQSPADFPEEIRSSAGSLRMYATQPVSRFEVASALLEALRPIAVGLEDDPHISTEELSARDAVRGREIEVLEPESGRVLHAGIARGIDSSGTLQVSTLRGMVDVRTGTVRLRSGVGK